MGQIIQIANKKVFHLEEAQLLVPIIVRMTESANIRVRELIQRLEMISEKDSSQAQTLESEIDNVISQWQQKVEKLGAIAKGLWLVDFDNGEGYFCWKYPERQLMYCHGYQDGFSGRKTICENHHQLAEEN